jgi:iron complex outermembrane receptor protein
MKPLQIFAARAVPFGMAIVFACASSFAQEQKDTLKYEIEGVVIVGTRSTERIIDIPYSVFSVDKKELSFGRKISAKDVLADVPGMFLQSRFGNTDLRISLRGFGTRSNSGARAVRILVDGVPESDPDGESALDAIDFTSLGGVEVAKGNLSSLYANAPGGVINFMSDLYFQNDYAGSITQVGSFGLQHQGMKLGLLNTNNRLFFTYNYSNLDGYRQHSQQYLNLANFVYEAYLPNLSTVSVLGNYVNGVNKIPGPLTKEEFERDPFQANPDALFFDFKRITRKGKIGLRFQTEFNRPRKNELELTLYGAFKDLERADYGSYTLGERRTLGAWARFTNRSEIAGHSNTFTTGIDYAHQAGPITGFANFGGAIDPLDPSIKDNFDESLNNVGVYAINRFSILEDLLDATLSTRYDRNVFSRNVFVRGGIARIADTNRVFDSFAPKIGLNYKLSRSVALYSSYGLSYDIPALSEMSNTQFSSNIEAALNPDLDPQKTYNFELGIKGNLVEPDRKFLPKLFFDLTFFHYLIKDEIIPVAIRQQTFYRNAARTSRTGVELGLKTHPIRHLEMVVNYTYARFRYDNYIATIDDPATGRRTEDYSGNTVPSIPKGLLNFIAMYELEISEDVEALFLWDCDYISTMFVNDANTATAPAYFYGNILLGLNFRAGQFGGVAYAGIHNIFDRRYASYINVNEFFGRYYDTGEPRSYYAGLRVSYTP